MVPLVQHMNNTVRAYLKPLTQDAQERTYLTADASSGASTITVENINNFSTSNILIIGEIGSETCEILKTHASTSPSGTTITLASNLVFAHSRGTHVYKVQFDQIEFSHAATLSGSKSVIQAATALDVDSDYQEYLDTTNTSGFFFARFKETVGGTFSSYSDGVPYAGWATNQLGFAADYALKRNSTKYSGDIDQQFMIDEANACLSNIQGKLKRWPQYQNFNTVMGQTARGTNIVALPSDIYNTDSFKSLLAVRIGDQPRLSLIDAIKFEEKISDVKVTQVTTEASASDTTLEIDNSYDFDDSGSVNVYISGTKYNITYTGVTRSATAGVLTGVPSSGTGSITVTIPVDTYVWQDEEEGLPLYGTVRNGNFEFYPLADGTYDNMNIYGDYWTAADSVDSLGDTLDTNRADMVKYWLTWKVRMQTKNKGVLDFKDGDYQLYKETLNDAIRTMIKSVKGRTGPKINTISY